MLGKVTAAKFNSFILNFLFSPVSDLFLFVFGLPFTYKRKAVEKADYFHIRKKASGNRDILMKSFDNPRLFQNHQRLLPPPSWEQGPSSSLMLSPSSFYNLQIKDGGNNTINTARTFIKFRVKAFSAKRKNKMRIFRTLRSVWHRA